MKACLHCVLNEIVAKRATSSDEGKDLRKVFAVLAPAFQVDPCIMEACFRLDRRSVALSVCVFSSGVERRDDMYLFDVQFGGRFARFFSAVPDSVLGTHDLTLAIARQFRGTLQNLGFGESHELIERWTQHTPRRTRRKHLRQGRAYHAYHPDAFPIFVKYG